MLVALIKGSTLRTAVIVFALALLVTIALWPKDESAVQAETNTNNTGISTNEERIQYLKSFGWEVDADPIEVVEIIIPETFNAVYENYNTIQKSQGFDLAKYQGRRVKRWTYRITNYPNVHDEVHANLLIYNNTVIAGDISTVSLSGFMQGLAMPPTTGAGKTQPGNADITQGLFSSAA